MWYVGWNEESRSHHCLPGTPYEKGDRSGSPLLLDDLLSQERTFMIKDCLEDQRFLKSQPSTLNLSQHKRGERLHSQPRISNLGARVPTVEDVMGISNYFYGPLKTKILLHGSF